MVGPTFSEGNRKELGDTHNSVRHGTCVLNCLESPKRDFAVAQSKGDKHARLRESPMAPGDLFAAAEKVMIKLAEKEENDDSTDRTNRHIRMQVYRSVKHLLNVADDDDELAPYDDKRWDTFKERCEPLAIQWDETTQAFTSNAASSGR